MTNEAEKDINEILAYDPFAEQEPAPPATDDKSVDDSGKQVSPEDDGGSKPPADSGGDAGSKGAEGESQKPPEDSAGADDGTGSPQKPAESHDPAEERIKALEEQLRQTSVALQNLQQGKEGQEPEKDAGKKPESEADSQPEIPSYEFQIPPQISEGIQSDDPQQRATALAQLVRGIGVEVHARVRQEFDDKLRKTVEYQQTQQQQVQTQEQQKSQQEEIRKDYFSAYKNHDSDIIRPVVQRKAGEVFKEWNVQTWTPNVRDEIARRVETELRQSGFTAAGGNDNGPKPNGHDPNPPPHQRKSGARPGGSGGPAEPNSVQDIESTLFGG